MSGMSDSYDEIYEERAAEQRKIDKARYNKLLVGLQTFNDVIISNEVCSKVPQRFIDSLEDFKNYVIVNSERNK